MRVEYIVVLLHLLDFTLLGGAFDSKERRATLSGRSPSDDFAARRYFGVEKSQRRETKCIRKL